MRAAVEIDVCWSDGDISRGSCRRHICCRRRCASSCHVSILSEHVKRVERRWIDERRSYGNREAARALAALRVRVVVQMLDEAVAMWFIAQLHHHCADAGIEFYPSARQPTVVLTRCLAAVSV